MAERKRGLGRGLNALLGDVPLKAEEKVQKPANLADRVFTKREISAA
jgi:hypothetical protein